MTRSFKKLPWYSQVAAFFTVAAIALGAWFSFYESQARQELAGRQKQLAALRIEMNKAMEIARKLPEFRAQVTDLGARLDSLEAVLPEQKDVGDLLRRLQTLATQSNLEIRGFKPQAIVQKQLHAEWPIQLELDGSYHDLALFFDKVSKVPRIINISNIAIKGSDASRSHTRRSEEDPAVTVSVTCVATTFVLSEQPAQPAANARGGAARKNAAAAQPRG